MNITATRFGTQIRTWPLVAGQRIRRLRALDGDRAIAMAA
jgi:hypothetical protein